MDWHPPCPRELGMTDNGSSHVSPQDLEGFYAAAVAGLRALDARERAPRRFGAEADARWSSFKGALTESDRIDLLLRDASVTWGAAFSPAEAFGLFGLAADESFGPDWPSLAPPNGGWFETGNSEPPTPAQVAIRLGVASRDVEIPPLSPSTRLAVAGGAALVALAEAFSVQPELSWSDQVLAIATAPSHRQLAGLMAILTGSASRTRVTRPGDDLRGTLKAAGFTQIDAAVVTSDAEPACAAFAYRIAGVA